MSVWLKKLLLIYSICSVKLGIKTFAAKMAIKHNIKLIIYGEPYAEYGSQDEKETDSPKYQEDWFINDSDVLLGGLKINEIIKNIIF